MVFLCLGKKKINSCFHNVVHDSALFFLIRKKVNFTIKQKLLVLKIMYITFWPVNVSV